MTSNNDMTSFEWSPKPGYIIRLMLNSSSAHPTSFAEDLTTARSIH